MWRIVLVGFALVLIAASATIVGTEAHALLAPPALLDCASGTVVKIKHQHCKRQKVCDYFAPASSCSNPPCCKKWHFEKNCGMGNGASPGTPTEDSKCPPITVYVPGKGCVCPKGGVYQPSPGGGGGACVVLTPQ
jgi:hypothetical protein